MDTFACHLHAKVWWGFFILWKFEVLRFCYSFENDSKIWCRVCVMVGLGYFVLLCYPASCILHWYTLPNKHISSIPLRSEEAGTAEVCRNLCAAAADSEGCCSVNFDSSGKWCELFGISAIETVIEDRTGADIYESCPMLTTLGGWTVVKYIPRNTHTVFALLCFVVVIHWLVFQYPSGLLHWHCGNLTIAPVPAKQPWWIWINTSCEFIMNDCITTTKQSTTKPCAYFLGYTVCLDMSMG